MRLRSATKFIELLDLTNRLAAVACDHKNSANRDLLERLSVISDEIDHFAGKVIHFLELKTVAVARMSELEPGNTRAWTEYMPVVTPDQVDRVKKLVVSEWFEKTLAVEIDRTAIKELKVPIVLYLENLVLRSGYAWTSRNKMRQLTEEAIKSALSMGKALKPLEQGILIGDVLDELFGYGPLGLFIRDKTLDHPIEMNEAGVFHANAKTVEVEQFLLFGQGLVSAESPVTLDLVFDNDEHEMEILARITGPLVKSEREEHEGKEGKEGKEGYVDYGFRNTVMFRLPKSCNPPKSRQELLFENLIQ